MKPSSIAGQTLLRIHRHLTSSSYRVVHSVRTQAASGHHPHLPATYIASCSTSASAGSPREVSTSSDLDSTPESFIDRVKRLGVNAIVGSFTTTGVRFDSVLEGMEVTRIQTDKGIAVVELEVRERLANAYGTLHGGATSTIVDVVGTLALLTRDPTRAGVSVELSTSFLSAAKVGSRIRCIGKVSKAGRRLGFTTVEIWTLKRGTESESDWELDRLVAEGRHTKAL